MNNQFLTIAIYVNTFFFSPPPKYKRGASSLSPSWHYTQSLLRLPSRHGGTRIPPTPEKNQPTVIHVCWRCVCARTRGFVVRRNYARLVRCTFWLRQKGFGTRPRNDLGATRQPVPHPFWLRIKYVRNYVSSPLIKRMYNSFSP